MTHKTDVLLIPSRSSATALTLVGGIAQLAHSLLTPSLGCRLIGTWGIPLEVPSSFPTLACIRPDPLSRLAIVTKHIHIHRQITPSVARTRISLLSSVGPETLAFNMSQFVEKPSSPSEKVMPMPTTSDKHVHGVGEQALVDPNARLEEMGYKQELQRNLGMISILGLSFAIMAVPFGTSTTLNIALTDGGPVTILYGVSVMPCRCKGVDDAVDLRIARNSLRVSQFGRNVSRVIELRG